MASRRLTFGVGVWGPPGVGRYAFPDANYTKVNGKYEQNPVKYSPNRYALISNDILIYYPTFSVAYDLHPMVQAGLSFQVVGSSFKFKQALYSGLTTPTKMTDEDPIFDSVASVRLNGQPGLTGIAGIMVRPMKNLSIGASVRPPVHLHATGTLDIALGEAAKGLNTQVTGNQTTLDMNLPLEARVGVMFQPIEKLTLVGDYVYMGWNAFDKIVLTPQGVTMTIGSGEPQTVAPVTIPKNWVATSSARIGGSYDVIPMLTVHAGFLYETQASPDAFYSVDFAHPARFFVTGGVAVHVSGFDVVASAIYTPTVTTVVTDSKQLQGQTDPTIPGGPIGNGIYTSGGWVVNFGVRGRFGATPKEPAMELAPTSTPAPEPPISTPAPAPAPEPTPAVTPPASSTP
jgi:long-subunit fatty acid transport protein